MAIRLSLSVIVGVVVTLALFYLMQALIQGADSALTEDKIGNLVDFVRVKNDPELQTKERKPKKPPPPDEPPPETPPQNFDVNVDKTGFSMSNVDTAIDINVGSGGFGISDGEYLPIVKVAPIYPRRAQTRGISGYCIVEYTVTKTGSIRDPFPVDCQPKGIFERASLKASEKFKYKPRVVDGEPIEVAGVQNKFTYELEN